MTDFLKREGREVVGSGRCRRESPSQRLGLKTGKLRPREAKQLVQYHSGRQSRTAVSAPENSPPGERIEGRGTLPSFCSARPCQNQIQQVGLQGFTGGDH